MRGQDVYQILFDSLDLPETVKAKYLDGVLKKYSVAPEELSLEVLREIVADLLQETILEIDQDETLKPSANQ